MAMARSQLTAQARRQHTFLLPTLSDVLPLESLLVLLLFSSLNSNSTPYIRSSRSGSVSGFLVLSHTFQNVQSRIRNHSVPQITVSLVRQAAHNMHTACITSCIHVTKNSNNALPLLALRRASYTRNYNIQWVHDNTKKPERALQHKLADWLFHYRNTPQTTTNHSPAELFLKRNPRMQFSMLKPNLQTDVQDKQNAQKYHHDTGRVKQRKFHQGQKVAVRNHCKGKRNGHQVSS